MDNQLQADLERHSKLAFRRMKPGAELLRLIRTLPAETQQSLVFTRIYSWLLVPFSLWPVDIIGVASHLLALYRAGKPTHPRLTGLIELLGDPPAAETCACIGAHEHNVKGGSYETLIEAQHKFDAKEELLKENPGFIADWNLIKQHFDVAKYQSDTGVIRRRMVSERSFRLPEWDFRWKSADDQFYNIFDAFCHKWVLYGMEGDQPLLQKLSVNITPYGTMIVIPRYWSFDSHRDLNWRAITRLHHSRGVAKQGLKLGTSQKERREQAKRARHFAVEAAKRGLKGDKKDDWIISRLGLHPETDRKQLWRLLKRY